MDFIDDVMASDNEVAKNLLRLTGCVEQSERPCEHQWEKYGTVNGIEEYRCQNCGEKR